MAAEIDGGTWSITTGGTLLAIVQVEEIDVTPSWPTAGSANWYRTKETWNVPFYNGNPPAQPAEFTVSYKDDENADPCDWLPTGETIEVGIVNLVIKPNWP